MMIDSDLKVHTMPAAELMAQLPWHAKMWMYAKGLGKMAPVAAIFPLGMLVITLAVLWAEHKSLSAPRGLASWAGLGLGMASFWFVSTLVSRYLPGLFFGVSSVKKSRLRALAACAAYAWAAWASMPLSVPPAELAAAYREDISKAADPAFDWRRGRVAQALSSAGRSLHASEIFNQRPGARRFDPSWSLVVQHVDLLQWNAIYCRGVFLVILFSFVHPLIGAVAVGAVQFCIMLASRGGRRRAWGQASRWMAASLVQCRSLAAMVGRWRAAAAWERTRRIAQASFGMAIGSARWMAKAASKAPAALASGISNAAAAAKRGMQEAALGEAQERARIERRLMEESSGAENIKSVPAPRL